MNTDIVQTIEAFARPFMVAEIGHDFKHIDRVRNWARRIAQPLVAFMRMFVLQLESEVQQRSERSDC